MCLLYRCWLYVCNCFFPVLTFASYLIGLDNQVDLFTAACLVFPMAHISPLLDTRLKICVPQM